MPDKAAKNKQNRPAKPREQLDIPATMEPGREAEELRSGIEQLIESHLRVDAGALQRLLDRIDARDSLAHLERTDDLRLLQARVTELETALTAAQPTAFEAHQTTVHHGLDTDEAVCFYEQEFYPLSNFSAFTLEWKKFRFDTSEAAYHWEKFPGKASGMVRFSIRTAPSAHAAFQIAQDSKAQKRPDWDAVKVDIMRDILRTKVDQHPYVRKKLLETGRRRLVENSWRDGFWGWGEHRDGKNTLGKLWMEIRSEIQTTKAQLPACTTHTAEPARTGVKLQRAAFEYERERAADPDPRDEEDEIISTEPECAETGPEGSPPQEEP